MYIYFLVNIFIEKEKKKLFFHNLGTGSGSLSHSLIRTIRPNGHLYTFDFHEQRVLIASSEFERHGLSDYVTLEKRDICLEGFGEELKYKVDAVFLDLPHPWLAIQHATIALKEKGKNAF